MQFSVDGPLWEAFAWSAGEAPLFLIPLCFLAKIRAEFISIYAEEPSGDAGSDLSSNLLAHDNVQMIVQVRRMFFFFRGRM